MIMDSSNDLVIWGPNSSVKDVNHWTSYIDDLFIVAKACVEKATLFC